MNNHDLAKLITDRILTARSNGQDPQRGVAIVVFDDQGQTVCGWSGDGIVKHIEAVLEQHACEKVSAE